MVFRTVLIYLCGAAVVSAAELTWEATVKEQTAKVGQDTVELAFGFSNPTDRPLTIVELKPSCGCVTAFLEKRAYGPGEKGRIEAFFDARNLSGEHRQTIQVFTADSPKPTTLELRVIIPPWLEIAPRLMAWSVGEKNTEKAVVVVPAAGANVRVTAVTSDSDAFEISHDAEEVGRRVRLTARPCSTANPVQATLKLVAEIPGAAPRSYIVYAQVR